MTDGVRLTPNHQCYSTRVIITIIIDYY